MPMKYPIFISNSDIMNDNFISVVKRLPKHEIELLIKKLSDKRQKVEIINYILERNNVTNESIIDALYADNPNAYYVLKHRLIDDLTSLKIDLGRNILIETREAIDNLRSLLYAEEYILLEKSLKTLSKKVQEYHLYSSNIEIQLCYYLLYYNNPNKREYYKKKVDAAQKDYSIFSFAELNFYHMVFQSLDIFYYNSKTLNDNLHSFLCSSESYYSKLKCEVTHFLWLSCKLTVLLSPANYLELNKNSLNHLFKELNELRELYVFPSVYFRYPNCEFAIECLFNRYYYLADNTLLFKKSLEKLKEEAEIIKSYRMYENVYFYYLYISSSHYVNERQYKEISDFLKASINNDLFVNASDKIKFYYYYLLAISQIYSGEYSDAHSIVLKSREYRKVIEQNNSWILIENYAVSILIQLTYPNPINIENEINTFKRLLKNYDHKTESWSVFLKIVKNILKKSTPIRINKLLEDFNTLKQKENIAQLIDINYILKL